MGKSGIEQLLYAMDRAFEGDPKSDFNWHALMVNLASVDRKDWTWLPPGGNRTIFSLVEEIGGCKFVYASQAFGDRSMHWFKPGSIPGVTVDTPTSDVYDWLRDSHQRLRAHVVALEDDAELLRLRLSPQGHQRETRWIVTTTIEHDIYHAGEINHLRALCQGND